MRLRLPRHWIRKPKTRAGWIILALIVANEIRGLIVVATIGPAIWKAWT